MWIKRLRNRSESKADLRGSNSTNQSSELEVESIDDSTSEEQNGLVEKICTNLLESEHDYVQKLQICTKVSENLYS